MNCSATSIVEKIKQAKRVYIIGNGGSFANAMHMQNDLESVGIKAHTLNPASLTRTANDREYKYVFSDWLSVHGEPGDLLIALSGSGTSKNILGGVVAAEMLGMQVVLVTDYLRTRNMQQSEEDQIVLAHDLMRSLR